MASTVSGLRDALKTRLATIAGLRTHDTWPAQIHPPAAIVEPLAGSFEQTLGSDDALYRFQIVVAVQFGTHRTAQDALDEYLTPSGTRSIRAALEGDVTLGGLAHSLSVTGWREYGTLEINGIEYLGAFVDVSVWAL